MEADITPVVEPHCTTAVDVALDLKNVLGLCPTKLAIEVDIAEGDNLCFVELQYNDRYGDSSMSSGVLQLE